MGEIGDAVQLIKVMGDGVELVFKVAGATVDKIVDIATLIIGLINKEKLMGKTTLKDMLKKGGDIQVFQFDEKYLKEFEKYAKDYGILYTKLPDINKGDGLTEVLFPTEAVPRVNMLLQKLGNGQIISVNDYLDNGVEEEKKEAFEELSKITEKVEGMEKAVDSAELKTPTETEVPVQYDSLIEMAGRHVIESGVVDKNVIRDYFGMDDSHAEQLISELEAVGAIELSENGYVIKMNREQFDAKMAEINNIRETLEAAERASNKNLVDITINEKLIAKETDTKIKTRIPKKPDEFIWLDKNDVNIINKGKTILSFLDKDKDYEIVNAKDEVVRTESGTEVFKNYDPVEQAVREREEKKKRQEKDRSKVRENNARNSQNLSSKKSSNKSSNKSSKKPVKDNPSGKAR